MRLALAQIDSVVGDLDGNRDRILTRLEEARQAGAELVLFPELAVTGYPPEDLLLRPGFIQAAERTLGEIARATEGLVALVGTPHYDGDLFNACAVCSGGEVKAIYRKRFLPNYGVFDEDRYFAPGRDLVLLRLGETLVGVTICEDMWQPGPPATDLALAGAQLLVNVSASPFHVGKDREREEMFAARARDNSAFVALCNMVGGQDELVFDGHSVVLDDEGERHRPRSGLRGGAAGRRRRSDRGDRAPAPRRAPPGARARAGGGAGADSSSRSRPRPSTRRPQPGGVAPLVDDLEQMRLALELGLRAYVDKNGFRDVVVGLSGGIDSALTAALAAEALGPERVHCVSMPSQFSSAATRDDARRLAESIGVDFREIPIDDVVSRVRGGARAVVRRRGARPDRGERAGTGARHAADGAVEQVRLARARDREQVGALGRLRHALRRHGRRVRAPQGHVQDGRVAALAAAERAGRPRADPRVDHRSRADAPSCAPTSSTRTRCLRTPRSTPCSRPTSSTTARARSCSRTASTATRSSGRSR